MGFYATDSCPSADYAATCCDSVRRPACPRATTRRRAPRHVPPKAICLFWQVSESGFRFYSPELGRWTARDPIEEAGGINIYSTVGNNVICGIDTLGAAWLRAENRGKDFYYGYLLYGYRSSRDPILQRMVWHGGTARLITNDERKPVIVEASKPNCYCVKDGTGLYTLQFEYWGVRAGVPGFDEMDQASKQWRQEIIRAGGTVRHPYSVYVMTQDVADYGTWHEETEVNVLLKQLFQATVEVAESRSRDYGCDRLDLKPIGKQELIDYIRWDVAKAAFFAETTPPTHFDQKFGITPSRNLWVPQRDRSEFKVSDFDEWYKPNIWR